MFPTAILWTCASVWRTPVFPNSAPGEPWLYGTDVGYLRSLVDTWRRSFDWRAQEARLNAFPQFKMTRPEYDLHFLHVPGKGPNPTPLLLMHGWPGSVFEFMDFIPRLTDPASFGGGDPAGRLHGRRAVAARLRPMRSGPGQTRFGVEEIADCFADLMTDTLGYKRFAVQGGDWGGITAARMGYAHADKLIGIHVNFLAVRREPELIKNPTPEQQVFIDQVKYWLKEDAAYASIQGTRPQTLSFALTNSPAGLAAWIVEKFRAWSDCGGDVESVFTRDQMLANISFYWFTGAIGSSFYPYYFRMHRPWMIPAGAAVTAPTAYAEFPKEIAASPALAGRADVHKHSPQDKDRIGRRGWFLRCLGGSARRRWKRQGVRRMSARRTGVRIDIFTMSATIP